MTRSGIFALFGIVTLLLAMTAWWFYHHESSHIVHYEELPRQEDIRDPILIRYNTGEEYVVERVGSRYGWVTNVYNYNTGEYVRDPWGSIERDFLYQRSLSEARVRRQQWQGK